MYIKDPLEIERKSFEIIGYEMGENDFTEEELSIVKRVIHTTADFEYKDLLVFNNSPIDRAINEINKSFKIYTDTLMIKSGINKKNLERLNGEIINYTHEEDVKILAEKNNTTRSMEGIKKALSEGDISIFVIGNAPTALFSLLESIKDKSTKPFIIGVPVGFVGAEESKDLLIENTDISYISVKGRKGGSTVAASIVNALMKISINRHDING